MALLVVGVDVGGTSTRVGIADRDGAVRAVAGGAGANPNSVGLAETAHRVRTLVEQALADAGAAADDIGAVTVALAGATRVLAAPERLSALQDGMSPAGLRVGPRLVQDVAAAFAAGSPADAGAVLVAGTGSIAALVDRGEVVSRVGGWGWLLGDEGSGFWLGREAVRHALVTLESGGARGPLAEAVLRSYDVTTATELLAAAYARATGDDGSGAVTRSLAGLSREVADLVDRDPAADALVDRAVDELVALVERLPTGSAAGPLVLAGSLLTTPGPVGARAATRLREGAYDVAQAGPAVVGSLWLSLRSLGLGDDAVHRRLSTGVDR